MSIPPPPSKPGVYIYKDKSGTILYVGKAKNLKKRVSSYFQSKDHTTKTLQLVSQITDAEYFITKNELESFLLESKLIKQHQPKYNILLKSGSTYPYIKVTTEEDFPRMVVARSVGKKGKYFGPIVGAEARTTTIRTLRKVFKIRSCQPMPKRECLYAHIDMCTAPCVDKISKADYAKNVRRAMDVLKGKTQDVIDTMEKEMKTLSDAQEYEQAKSIRDQIRALEVVVRKQSVQQVIHKNEDVFAWVRNDTHTQFIVMHIEKGVITGKDVQKFENLGDEMIEDFIARYYEFHEVPHILLLQEEVGGSGLVQYLESLAGRKVEKRVPKKGEKIKLLEIAQENAYYALNEKVVSAPVSELQTVLKLRTAPVVMECFDISTIQGTSTVASMVQFKDGKPNKKEYRHFHVKTVVGQDDFASMREVVGRRYKRLLSEGKPLPDIIVIDGGPQQLRFAAQSLNELALQIPIISLAKREEEIYTLGLRKPIVLSHSNKALKMLMHIRDEAHRFAITFHRKTRAKAMVKSLLDDVPGMGPKKRELVLKRYGSVEKLKLVPESQLAEVIGKKVASELKKLL